jgi:hypothetical protein
VTGAAGNSAKSDGMTRRMPTDELLLQSPARLDWIQIRRVRRQIEQPYTVMGARGANSRVVMSAKVVHDEDVASAKFWEEGGLEPSNEAVLVCGSKHGRLRDPAGKSNRAEHGEVGAPIHWNSVDELVTALDPSVGSTHRQVHAGFVEKYESFGGHAANPAQERFALGLDVGPQTFQRPAAFFLTT